MLNPIEEIMLKIVLNDFMESYDSDKKDEKQNKHECKCDGNCEHEKIIHCKDCKNYNEKVEVCTLTHMCVKKEDFCSGATKKETIETITKDEYEILSMLKSLGAEFLRYYSFEKYFSAYKDGRISMHFDERNFNINKNLFNEKYVRQIDDLMKLEVIE